MKENTFQCLITRHMAMASYVQHLRQIYADADIGFQQPHLACRVQGESQLTKVTMLDSHGTEVGCNALMLVQKLQPCGWSKLRGRQRGHSESAAHAKVDVHDCCLLALPKKVE